MVMASEILPDRYRSGRYLRRWSLVDGFPRCVLDAIDTTIATAEEVDATEAGNVAVHAAVEAVEVYEAAVALTTSRTQPLPLPVLTQLDGSPWTPPNPALDAWTAAEFVLASVTPETLELARLRQPATAFAPSLPLLGAAL